MTRLRAVALLDLKVATDEAMKARLRCDVAEAALEETQGLLKSAQADLAACKAECSAGSLELADRRQALADASAGLDRMRAVLKEL